MTDTPMGPPADATGLPSLAELTAVARSDLFPVALVKNALLAISFFSAGFFGRNDVINLHVSGVQKISLNDIDQRKLEHMQAIYPSCEEILVGDAYATARRLRDDYRTFQIVVCDPFTNRVLQMATDYFPLFRGLASKSYIFGINADAMAQIGAEADAVSLGAALSRLHGEEIAVEALILRNPSISVYWAAVGRSAAGRSSALLRGRRRDRAATGGTSR